MPQGRLRGDRAAEGRSIGVEAQPEHAHAHDGGHGHHDHAHGHAHDHDHDHDHNGHSHDHGHVHDHAHGAHDHGPHDHAAVWALDNVELTTVGIDVGSSTSHFMFARVHLQRLTTALVSRFEVVARDVLWESPVVLTPYRADETIDAERLEEFFESGYRAAGIARPAVDAGAVILTGEALKRHNAREIAALFAQEAGKFVCASAGHHMEAALGAHGSGAVRLSAEQHATVLNVDIGGGTTKFALIRSGTIAVTSAIAVGARSVVVGDDGRILRLEEPAREIARELGISLELGGVLAAPDRARLVARMVELLAATIAQQPPDALARRLLVTAEWPAALREVPIALITFSGGVSEFLYGREGADFGDLGDDLARGLRTALGAHGIADRVRNPGQGIRATVIGAAQFSVQVSGNTIAISRREQLPLHNLRAVPCDFGAAEEVDPQTVAATVRDALGRADLADGDAPIGLAFRWAGTPSYPRLAALARGIVAALPRTLAAGLPLVLLIDGDVGLSLGRLFAREIAPGANVLAVDGIELKDLEYVDVGEVLEPADVVPVTIKSLLF